MFKLNIQEYSKEYEEKWDYFILNTSTNGTFLHTRNFLNYHKKRFIDRSLMILNEKHQIISVIPACEINEETNKIFFSHKGSTFGGIIIGHEYDSIEYIQQIILLLENYLKENQFSKIILRNTSDIFCKRDTKTLDYFLYKEGYSFYSELSFYIDLNGCSKDISANFTVGKRRDYHTALKSGLTFSKIDSQIGIEEFYQLLQKNLIKFNKKPVHTLEELIEFKEHRLKEYVDFYGVFYNEKLISGSMVFKFDNRCFHTQYLAMDYDYSKLFPMIFLNYNLIRTAFEENFRYFSFGISTEQNGKELNWGLAKFKEGFGSIHSINQTYYKEL